MKTLSEYLESVWQLEKNKYMLQQMFHIENQKISRIDARIAELRAERNVKLEKEELPPEQENPDLLDFIIVCIITTLKCVAAGFVIYVVLSILFAVPAGCGNGSDIKYFNSLLNSIMNKVVFALIIVDIGWNIFNLVVLITAHNDYIDAYNQIIASNQRKEDAHKALCKKNDVASASLMGVRSVCCQNLDMLKNKLAHIEEVLTSYYSLDIIYAKYRNLDAVCKMLEYIQSGRCNTFYGANGAYDIYEKERRTDIIIEKLDIVIEKLDEIKETNITLYHTLRSVNASLGRVYEGISAQQRTLEGIGRDLGKGIGELEKNTEAVKLLAEVTHNDNQQIKEYAEYQAFAARQQRLNDGRWT